MKNIAIVAAMVLALVSCNDEKKKSIEAIDKMERKDVKVIDNSGESAMKSMTIQLESKSGSDADGVAYITQKADGVLFEAKISGLTPGMHAIHLHEKADCSSDDGKSSGGHWNPTFKSHGKWGAEEGYHKGDIGNFEVGSQGIGKISMKTDEWCVGCGDKNKDILGKAIIVHQGEDDFTSQPSGAAGKRVSCGGIIK